MHSEKLNHTACTCMYLSGMTLQCPAANKIGGAKSERSLPLRPRIVSHWNNSPIRSETPKTTNLYQESKKTASTIIPSVSSNEARFCFRRSLSELTVSLAATWRSLSSATDIARNSSSGFDHGAEVWKKGSPIQSEIRVSIVFSNFGCEGLWAGTGSSATCDCVRRESREGGRVLWTSLWSWAERDSESLKRLLWLCESHRQGYNCNCDWLTAPDPLLSTCQFTVTPLSWTQSDMWFSECC